MNDGNKNRKKTLKGNYIPVLAKLAGKVGVVLGEGLLHVEEGAKTGREAIEARLSKRIDGVAVDAGAAAADAAKAKAEASTAAEDAKKARDAAEFASKDARAAAGTAESMAEDVKTATRATTIAEEAKATADQASQTVKELTDALTVGDKSGKDAIAWVLDRVEKAQTAFGGVGEKIRKAQDEIENKLGMGLELLKTELTGAIKTAVEASEDKMAKVLEKTVSQLDGVIDRKITRRIEESENKTGQLIETLMGGNSNSEKEGE